MAGYGEVFDPGTLPLSAFLEQTQAAPDDTPAARYAAYIRGSHPDAAPMWDATDVRGWADAAERYAATLRARGVDDSGYRRLIAEVRRNPDGYYLSNGSAVKKPMSSAQAVGLGALYLGGMGGVDMLIGAPAAAATGVTSSAIPVGTGATVGGVTGAVTGGGSAAGASGMGFFSSLGKFLGSPGGQAVTDLGGRVVTGAIQSRAQNRATDAQTRATDAALAFEREVYENDRRDYEPWRHGLMTRLGDLTQRPAPTSASSVMASGAMPTLGQLRQPEVAPRGVRLRAPTGEVQEVPESAAGWYLSRGAVRV